MKSFLPLTALVFFAATLFAEEVPFVRYTPPDIYTARISLSGVWRFYPNVEESFIQDPYAEELPFLTMPIPGEIEKFFPEWVRGVLDSTGFHREIHVPAGWAGRSIKLRFQSIEGLAHVYVNGEFVGRHAAPWVPVEFDATQQMRPGEVNTITLFITSNPTIVNSSRGFLGMGFEPELIALPPVHIASLHIETTFDANYRDADLHLRWIVVNESDEPSAPRRIEFALTDPAGESVALTGAALDLPAIEPGDRHQQEVVLAVAAPLHWTPESPHLYRLETRLLDGDKASHTAQHRVGFRQIEVGEDHVLLNGRVLKVRGVGYHHVPHYERLHAVTREDFRRDLELLKYANFNMIRIAPHVDLLELCDELGLMNSIEPTVNMVEMSWMPQTHGLGTNEVFHSDYLLMLRHIVETFRNHPSTIAWSLGNESLFTLPAFVEGGFLLQELDASRIVWAEAHEDESLGFNLPQTTVDNYHYPNLRTKGLPQNRPAFYGEWCHVHEYAKGDFRTDPTVLDFWVHAYEAHLDYMYEHEKVLGGYLFYSVGFTIQTTNVWGGVERDWGILDRYRRTKPEFWNVKKANSLLRLRDSGFAEDGRSVFFTLQNYSVFTPTDAYRWEGRLNGEAIELPAPPLIDPLATGTYTIPLPRAVVTGDQFLLDVWTIDGRLKDRYAVNLTAPIEPPSRLGVLTWEEADGVLTVSGGDYRWTIDLSTGLLNGGYKGEVRILEGGPYLTATRMHTRGSRLCENWTLDEIAREEADDGLFVTVRGTYDQAAGTFTYRFQRQGELLVDYDFEWLLENQGPSRDYHRPPDSMEMREVGISFALSPMMQRLAWNKDSYWSWYPENHIGRPIGRAEAFHVPLPGHDGPYDRLPWHLEANEFGTADFRSTKTGIRHARLDHLLDAGAFEVYSDGTQATRTYVHPERNQIFLTLVDQYGGGHERFLHGNGVFATPRIILDTGVRISGSGRFLLD